MKKIAISCHYDSYENKYKHYGPSVLVRDYFQYPVFQEGWCPFILPSIPYTDALLEQLLEGVSWVIIYGGFDIDPLQYGEQVIEPVHRYELRDDNEIKLAQYCIKNSIPLFGTCRGMQIINVATGGTLYQDINKQFAPAKLLIHESTRDDHDKLSHKVSLKEHSSLMNAVNTSSFYVNSFHHQAVKDLGEDLEIIAVSEDGIVEAVQHSNGKVLGVQRHPEFNYHCNIESAKIMSYFIQEICT